MKQLLEAISNAPVAESYGRVRSVVGLTISADVPLSRIGSLVRIKRKAGPPLLTEIVGFRDQSATLLPLGDPAGIGQDDELQLLHEPLSVRCGADLLGRVLDGLGQPMDGGPTLQGAPRALTQYAPTALGRRVIRAPLPLGIRSIDALCTLGEGQRVGLFAGAGLGKSTLLQQISRHTAADVVVLCLTGERGREVADFMEGLPEDTRARSVVVVATSDAPALLRAKAAEVATTIAESFADQGRRVLLLMDSLSRYARALREVGLAAGELPARRGYPPSVFAALPRLLERAGMRAQGSVTAIYSVLVEADDMEDPIADELRGLLDGHILLRRELAARGHFPAVDVLHSLSRLMPRVTSVEHQRTATALREQLAQYEASRDLIELGAYKHGSNPKLDAVLAKLDEIMAFLKQDVRDHFTFEQSVAGLSALSS